MWNRSRTAGVLGILSLTAIVGAGAAWLPTRADDANPQPLTAAQTLLQQRQEEVQAAEKKVNTLREELKLNLRSILREREIAVAQSRGKLEQARGNSDLAELQVKEFEEGTFPGLKRLAEGKIKLANAEFLRAKDQFDWSERMAPEGFISDRELVRAKLEFQKAEFLLNEEKTKLMILERYTKEKDLLTLQADAQKAKSGALIAELNHKIEQAKLEKATREVRDLQLLSPQDHVLALLGRVVRSQTEISELLEAVRKLRGEAQENPAQAELAIKKLMDAQKHLTRLQAAADEDLRRALALSEYLTERWEALLAAETELKQARDRLAIASGLFAPEDKAGK